MSDSYFTALTYLQGASLLISFVLSTATLIVISTVVRRHRPDAYQGLLVWSIVSLVGGAVLWLGSNAHTALARRGSDGIEALIRAQSINISIGLVFHIVLFILFVRGLVKIAQPPKPYVPETNVPYR
jgi:hypothetical protein